MTVTRPSRIAVAAVIAPLAFLATACGDDDGSGTASETTAATEPTETTGSTEPEQTDEDTPVTDTTNGGFDHVISGVWHQADGDEVPLPRHKPGYTSAVLWGDQLVATRWDGETYSIADVIDAEGNVVDTFTTTAPVAVNDSGTTIAWVDDDGEIMTRWADGQVSLGSVTLAERGETIAYSVAAITGGPSCDEDDGGCVVYLDSGIGDPQAYDSHGIVDNPVPGAVDFGDVSDSGLITYRDRIEDDGSCGGLVDLSAGGAEPLWHGCDVEAGSISPDGGHVAGLPPYYDGLGLSEITVRDARTGAETGRYAPEGGFITQWAWTPDGRLAVVAYDGARWHLIAMDTTGAVEEIADPVTGSELRHPITLVQR